MRKRHKIIKNKKHSAWTFRNAYTKINNQNYSWMKYQRGGRRA